MMSDVIVKKSLAEVVYDTLRNDIITQKIKCGQKLNLRELKERFKISSTPIREAFNRLFQEGLLDYVTNQGVRVVELDRNDVTEINNLRILFDCNAIEIAMQKSDRKVLIYDLEEAVNLQTSNIDNPEYRYYSESFHHAFYKHAENKRLSDFAIRLQGQYDILFYKYISQAHNINNTHDHELILEAVKSNDCIEAVELMKTHIMVAEKALLSLF
jgi:DNA-binding GntR family transcriptional regulator